jgi:hypothetical protein
MSTDRTKFIQGLRDLADYLDSHPAAPVPPFGACISIAVIGETDEAERAQVDAFAEVMGGKITRDGDGYYYATRSFGPVAYEAAAISAQRMAEYTAEQSYRGCVVPGEHAA